MLLLLLLLLQANAPRLSRAYAAKAKTLKETLAELIPKEIENVRLLPSLSFRRRTGAREPRQPVADALLLSTLQVKAIRKEHGNKSFGEYTVDQAYGCVLLLYSRSDFESRPTG